jgi:hypothetical protein
MNNTTLKFSRKKTILFACIIIGVFLGVAEVASYFVLRNFSETGVYGDRALQNNFHPFLGWEHPPNAHLRTTKSYSKQETFIDTDDRGLSITPIGYPDPQLHIAITGGSTMFGVGSTSNSMTVPSLVELEIYQRTGIRTEVHNLGVRGYQSFQETLKLREFLMGQKVDLVLAVSGRNDSSIAHRQLDPKFAMLPRHVYLNAVPLVRRAEQQQPILLNLDGYLRSVSYFADVIFRGFRRLGGWTGDKIYTGPSPTAGRNIFANVKERARATLLHFSMMKTVAENSGAEFGFMLQPTLYSWRYYDRDKFPDIPKGEPDNDVYEDRFFDEILKQGTYLPVIDMTGVMDEVTEPNYIDNSHYTDAGAHVLASAIVDRIEPALRRVANEKDR